MRWGHPVEHRADFEAGGFHLLEAAFDDPHAFVAKCDIGDREAIVIGGQHELAVEDARHGVICFGQDKAGRLSFWLR